MSAVDGPTKEGIHGMAYAGLGRRYFAVLIDAMIQVVVAGILVAIGVITKSVPVIVVLSIIAFLWLVLYPMFAMSRSKHNGQSWGKQMMGVRVVKDNGSPMTKGSAFHREYVGRMLGGMCFGLDNIMAIFDDENRAIHDKIAKTHVVKAQ